MGVFEPREPVVVRADHPQHLRRQIALRVDPLRLRGGADPRDLQLHHLLAGGRVHLAAQVHEAGAPIGELPQQVVLLHAHERSELRGHPGRVLDLHGVGEDGGRVLGDRELHAVAVVDRASLGRVVDVLDLLAHGAVGQRARAHRAEPGGAEGGDGEQQQEHREQQADPLLHQPGRRKSRPAPRAAGRGSALRRRHGLARRGGRGSRGTAAAVGSVGGRGVCGRRRIGRWPAAPARCPPARAARTRGSGRSCASPPCARRGAALPSGSAPRRGRAARGRAGPPTPGCAGSRPASPRRAGRGRSRRFSTAILSALEAISRFMRSRSTLKNTIPTSRTNTSAIHPRPARSASRTPLVRRRAARVNGALRTRTGSGSATVPRRRRRRGAERAYDGPAPGGAAGQCRAGAAAAARFAGAAARPLFARDGAALARGARRAGAAAAAAARAIRRSPPFGACGPSAGGSTWSAGCRPPRRGSAPRSGP